MKALIYNGPGEMEYTFIEFSNTPNQTEVLIAVRACCICGSDLHVYKNGGSGRIPPMIMGHEFAGVVQSVGADVATFRVGDRVTVQPVCFCGECHYCMQGRTNLCERKQLYGVKDLNGAMAEYICVDQKQVLPLPDDLSFIHAAMIEPLAVAYEAVNRAGNIKGKSAVVVGAGPIGLLIQQILRLRGASSVFVIDINEHRLKLSRQLGADDTLNPQLHDVNQWILKQTSQQGADIAFEAVGFSQTVQAAMSCLTKGGRCVWVGNAQQMIELDMKEVVLRELEILGTYAYTNSSFAKALNFLSEQPIELNALISATVPLSDGVDAFKKLANNTNNMIKTVLTINE